MSRFRILLIALVLTPLASCRSWSNVRFAPSPLAVAIAPDAGHPALGTVLFSWTGIESWKSGYAARFRVRVENNSAAALHLDPDQCELIDGSLIAFGKPVLEPISGSGAGTGWEVPPQGTAVWSLIFPFPDGGDPNEADLTGLHLTVVLVDGSGGIRVSASFDRLERERGAWGGSVYYGLGWSSYHHGGHGHHGQSMGMTTALRR